MDTFRILGLFTKDANAEANDTAIKPTNYVDTNGDFIRGVAGEAALSIYMLTRD